MREKKHREAKNKRERERDRDRDIGRIQQRGQTEIQKEGMRQRGEW